MNQFNHSVKGVVGLVMAITLLLAPLPVYASPIGDIISQVLTSTTADSYKEASTGSNVVNTLLAMLMGKLLGTTADHPAVATGKPSATTQLVTPATKNKELVGFYAEWWGTDTSSFDSLTQNSDVIKTIAPFWTTLDGEGTLLNRGGNDHAAVVNFAHEHNSSVLLLVNNAKPTQGPTPIHKLLSNPDLRTKAITNLENYLKKYNLDGVNIDFEMVDAQDKDNLTSFMKELSAQLKPQGYIISMDVFPKQDESNDVAMAYDYAQLANYADKIMIMTYDNHGTWSDAGPIADIHWVENNLAYALKFIPKNKLYLGIAAYGYDWSNKGVESLEYNALMALSQRYNSQIVWDEQSKSPHFSYNDGTSHQVWYENKESLKYKLDLITKYDIAGAALWKLGEEDPNSWPILKKYFLNQ